MILDERVRAELASFTRFSDVREFATIDSTNRYLAEEAAAGAPEGLVAVADHQSAGRGRLGRSWEAPPGSGLLVSILFRPVDLPVTRWHLVTAAVGLAARQAVYTTAAFFADLKWPNDLLVGDRKMAGILSESGAGAVVVGMGLNVSSAPPGATCVEEVAGRPVARADLLVALLKGLDARNGRWDSVAAEYRATCATIGRAVRVEAATGDLLGDATGVDDDGRLVVRSGDGRVVSVAAGDVVHVRPAAGRW